MIPVSGHVYTVLSPAVSSFFAQTYLIISTVVQDV